jgi:hypothetical protein
MAYRLDIGHLVAYDRRDFKGPTRRRAMHSTALTRTRGLAGPGPRPTGGLVPPGGAAASFWILGPAQRAGHGNWPSPARSAFE